VLAGAEADIVHIEMGEANSHDAKDMYFVIAVRDRAHLDSILTKLQRSAVVMHVKRSKKTA
jgi:GTP pyrophosphokinase